MTSLGPLGHLRVDIAPEVHGETNPEDLHVETSDNTEETSTNER